MFRPLLLSFMLLASLSAGEPLLADDPQELHGTFAGQRFWLRLLPPDQQFGKNRVLQLVYTPPAESVLDGAHLSDCPFLLINQQARIVAWNGRDTGSKAVPAAPTGYAITREVSVPEGDDRRIDLQTRTIPGERGWDLHVAPLLLALVWRPGSNADLRAVDLFGPRHAQALRITWQDTRITIAGTACTITADAHGRLHTLTAADGSPLLTIAARQ
jgi:hypothetical protein